MKPAKPKPESLTSKFTRLREDFDRLDDIVFRLEKKPDPIFPDIPEPRSRVPIWAAIFILALGIAAVMLISYSTVPVVFENQVFLYSPPAPIMASVEPLPPVTLNSEDLSRTSGLVLSLVVKQDCWYEGDSDGQKIPGRTWHAGATRNIGGEHEVTIRSGCPGGLEYTVNGQAASPVNQSLNPKIELVKFEAQEK